MPGFAQVALLISVLTAALPASAAEPVRLTQDGHLKQRPAWSPDGSQLVFTRHRGATIFLYVLDSSTSAERRLTMRDAPEYDAVFSPDGKDLLFSFDKTVPNQGDIEIYRLRLETGELTPLAVTRKALSHEEWPAWSPDGKRFAFTSTRDGNQELYVMSADGGEWTRLTSHPAIDAHPAWSPDGARIAFTSNRDGNLEIYAADAQGRNPVNLTQDAAIDNFPAWSPDGRLTWVSNRDGGFEVYVTAP